MLLPNVKNLKPWVKRVQKEPFTFHIPVTDLENTMAMSNAVMNDDYLGEIKEIPEGSEMQLPQGEMKLLDRVVSIDAEGGSYGKGEIIAEFDIHPDLWFFKCHFPGDPIMPGCLGLDAMWQTLGIYMASAGHQGKCRALGVGEVKLSGEVLPDVKTLRFQVQIKRVIKRGMVVGIGDGVVYADGKEIYSAKGLKAALIPSALLGEVND